MKRRTHLALVTAVLMLTPAAIAADEDLSWHSIDGGGGTSAGGGFELSGTIGQADAGTSSGADLDLRGGFLRTAAGATAPPCPTDLDGSGDVGFGDLLAVLSSWGTCEGCPADLDGSGDVGFPDLLAILSSWGPCPG